jgi:hypothetical protein
MFDCAARRASYGLFVDGILNGGVNASVHVDIRTRVFDSSERSEDLAIDILHQQGSDKIEDDSDKDAGS